MTGREEHAFTSVDEQADPRAWVELLDRVRAEPQYAAYKARLAELLQPKEGGRYLDVGSGTGSDALALATRYGAEAVGVDVSETMVEEARRRGLEAHVAPAEALPFPDGAFDGAWADRTVQHLADPHGALAEMARVTRPGGRLVVADPDYETQVVDVEDQELARRILRFRADHLLRNGTLAHRMGGLFVAAGLRDVVLEAVPIVLRDPSSLDNAMGLRTWAATAHDRGLLDEKDVLAWERQLDEAIRNERFVYAFSIFIAAGTKPETGYG